MLNSIKKDFFLFNTQLYSIIVTALYVWLGFVEGFSIGVYAYVGITALYLPLSLIFKRNVFVWYQIAYSLVLVFILAFYKTCLFNNFTAFFILSLAICLYPKIKISGIIIYSIAALVAFLINDESILHLLIHGIRCMYFYGLIKYITQNKYTKKQLDLTEDETHILRELASGKQQKEIKRFHKNTVSLKLKDAKERNNINSTPELILHFKNTQM